MQRGARIEVDFHGKKLGGMFVGFVNDGDISTVLMDEDTQTINVNTDSVVFMTKPGPRSHMRRVEFTSEGVRVSGYFHEFMVIDGVAGAIIEDKDGDCHLVELGFMRFDVLQPARPPRKP